MLKSEWKQSRVNFFNKCCELICNARPSKKPECFKKKDFVKPEDHITFEYVDTIQKNDLNNGIRAECGSKQKSSYSNVYVEPDITFNTIDRKFKVFFECKVLGRNSDYINKGISRFVGGRYEIPKMPLYGMLGYVKNNIASEKSKSLQKSINKKKNDINLTDLKAQENAELQSIFLSKHTMGKDRLNKKIEITHILHAW